MTPTLRRFGLVSPRRLVLALALFGLVAPAIAQERPKPDEFSQFDRYKSGQAPIDASAKELLDKVAKWFASRLTDPAAQKDGMSQLIQEFDRRLLLPPQNPYPRISPEQRRFVD